MNRLKVIFAGTPEFAAPCLEALIASEHDVIAAYTQPDRPAGRGQKLHVSPIKAMAQDHGIPVFQPQSLKKDADAVEALRRLDADVMVVVAYGLLLPQSVLDAPRLGCINVHASLLPRWRGAAPIQRAVLAGDDRTGVCIMRMEAGLDTGPVYHRAEIPIADDETGGTLHDKLAPLGALALLRALPSIADGSMAPEPQDDTLATYASKLSKEEAVIDWTQPATAIERQVRAFDPWPVAHTMLEGDVLRIWAAQTIPDPAPSAAPGTVIAADKTGIQVTTGSGLLRIARLQPSGKKPMSAADFLNGRNVRGLQLG